MKAVKFAAFRRSPTKYCNSIDKAKEALFVIRPEGKRVVIMDGNEFNAVQGTMEYFSKFMSR